jgi:acetylornithine deacetylase/succinyl-diaminopimelate desuccinylase-like protein
VPDDCRFTADIRFTPSLGRDGAYRAVEEVVEGYLRGHAGVAVELAVDPTCIRNPRHATVVASDAPISQAVAGAAADVLGRSSGVICHPAWPDTPVFNDMGIQAVTFGPGSTACYWPDEFVEIKDYLDAIKVYCLTAMDTCGCVLKQ